MAASKRRFKVKATGEVVTLVKKFRDEFGGGIKARRPDGRLKTYGADEVEEVTGSPELEKALKGILNYKPPHPFGWNETIQQMTKESDHG